MIRKYSPSLNQQNKNNSKLYEQYYLLFANDMVHWLEIAVIQRNDRMNKKVYKLSPRKGKSTFAGTPGEVRVFDSFEEALEYTINNDIT